MSDLHTINKYTQSGDVLDQEFSFKKTQILESARSYNVLGGNGDQSGESNPPKVILQVHGGAWNIPGPTKGDLILEKI